MLNSTFILGDEEGILSSLLKYDTGKSNSDSSCNDKCEYSTYTTDNIGILSPVACGAATPEHIQPLLGIVREHLYHLLPVKCLECVLSEIEGILSAISLNKLNTFLKINLKCIFKFNFSQKVEHYPFWFFEVLGGFFKQKQSGNEN